MLSVWCNRIRWVIPIVLGLLFALGDHTAANHGQAMFFSATLNAKVLMFVAVFVLVFFLIDRLISLPGARSAIVDGDRAFQRSGGPRIMGAISRLPFCIPGCPLSKQSVFIGFLIIFLCWIPYYILLFPGVYWSDTSSQLLQYYGYEVLSDHHPLLDTALFGAFADFGRAMFSSESLGLYLLIGAQIVSAALLFSIIINQLHKYGTRRSLCISTLLFVALFPCFPILFSSLVKDTVAAVAFLAFFSLYIRCVLEKKFPCVPDGAALLLLSLFAGLAKKTNAYIILFCLIALVVVRIAKRQPARVPILVLMMSAVFVFLFFPRVVLPVFGADPGGKQEMLAVPIQQIAHDVVYNDSDMTSSERSLIDNFLLLDYEEIPEMYSYEIVDNVKGRGLEDESLAPDFLKLWIIKTFEHPLGHLEAWIGLMHGWFGFRNDDGSPNYMIAVTESLWYYDPITEVIDWPITNVGGAQISSLYNSIESLPIINVLFYRSTWASIVPAIALFVALRRGILNAKNIAVLVPLIVSTLTLMVVPVSGYGGEPTRYLLQSICIGFPTLMLLGCGKCDEQLDVL